MGVPSVDRCPAVLAGRQVLNSHGFAVPRRDCRRWNSGAGHGIVRVVAYGGEGRTGERDGLMVAMEWIAGSRAGGALGLNPDPGSV